MCPVPVLGYPCVLSWSERRPEVGQTGRAQQEAWFCAALPLPSRYFTCGWRTGGSGPTLGLKPGCAEVAWMPSPSSGGAGCGVSSPSDPTSNIIQIPGLVRSAL